MYWPTRLQRIMLQIFPRRVRITIQGYGLHSTCRWRWWDSTPVWLFPLSIMRYISFYVIYTCDCTLIYTLMYCVCQHTDPGMAQKHRDLTVWGRVATAVPSASFPEASDLLPRLRQSHQHHHHPPRPTQWCWGPQGYAKEVVHSSHHFVSPFLCSSNSCEPNTQVDWNPMFPNALFCTCIPILFLCFSCPCVYRILQF